ncbi:unnamed protein product, partial [Symbiodinium necroappetens]
MITEALQTKVGPALQAAFSHVGQELTQHAVKINTLEQEIRMLKIRTAWTEKDLMYSQIEAAERTLVVRNFPEWATAEDRELTIARALQDNGLGHLEWDLTTTRMEGNSGVFLAPISILTGSGALWHKIEEEKTPAEDQDKEKDKAQSSEPQSEKVADAGEKEEPAASPSQWEEVRTWNWNTPVKMAPGITQFEPRLGAPMHGLMNAYQKLFPRFKKETLVPRWKTLILEDQEGAWLGRVFYSRRQRSLTGTTGTVSDARCEVQLHAEHKDRILAAWRDVWYNQLMHQIEHTEVETKAFATASQKTSQDYAAAARLNRFLTRAVPSYTDAMEAEIKLGDSLVGFAAQGTKRQYSTGTMEPYYPFDSQDELHLA